MRQDDGSDVGATFDLENPLHLEELRQTIPLKTIFSGLTEYQLWLLNLHEVEGLSYEEIGQRVNQHPAAVKFKLDAIEATIRAQVKAILGK